MRHIKIKLAASTQLTIKRWLLAASIATTNAIAATGDDAQTAYVDSVHNWGAWELDIEPAAGGIQAPGVQPLNARSANVSLRTNSIAALSPRGPQIIVAAPNLPTPAPVPVAPTIPTITPISPNVPIPGSAPNDGF